MIFPALGGAEVASYQQLPQELDTEWGLDGVSRSYLDRDDPARNVFRRPLGKQQSTQLTRFADGRLTDHVWSPDARRIAVVRRDEEGENVWVVDASGGSPKQVTKFDGQDVSQIEWTLDNQKVVVRAGNQSRDVVLISNFK